MFTNGATVWVDPSGNDSTGRRGSRELGFKTITAAKNAAQAGDTIHVHSGTYNDNNLLKAGVNYFFESGVTIYKAPAIAVPNSNWGIFDDRTIPGGTTNFIYGCPNLIFHTGTNTADLDAIGDTGVGGDTNCVGAIVLSNANTRAYYDIGTISFGTLTNVIFMGGVAVFNCAYAEINVREITDLFYGGILVTNPDLTTVTASDNANAIFWGLGSLHMKVPHIGPFSQYAIWPNQIGSTGADFHYTGDLIEAKVYQVGNNLNYKTWFEIKEIRNVGTVGAFATCFDVFGGKCYLKECQKIWNTNAAAANVSYSCVNVQSGAQVWVNAQKLAAGGTQGSFITMNQTGGGTLWADVEHFEDQGGLTNGIIVGIAGADLRLRGGQMRITNGSGMYLTAGTNHTEGLTIDTSLGTGTNKWPVVMSANGTYLQNCVLEAPANTFTAFAPSAVNLVSLGGGFSTNQPVHANVTIQGAQPTGGAFVK